MSIKYELSLWRDYPGSTGFREEKVDVLAATGMDFAGRAQNIVLTREYNGRIELEFEIPARYFDPFEGDTIINPLCSKVFEKSKIKLWRDEYWWNPFGGKKTYNESTECYSFTGEWQQGRWYDLIVNSHTEKRNKKQLIYTYKCNSLFMEELAHNGYSLEFSPDTTVSSANGMGTAHDLAKRIVDGTEWEYIKTEVFPDYKEEFNAVTGETVKIPVSTDRVEFVKNLDRYCNCYELKANNSDAKDAITNAIKAQLKTLKANSIVSSYYGFSGDEFWWRKNLDSPKQDFVYGHLDTNINVNAAKNIFSIDCGDMKYYTNSENKELTGATTFTNGYAAWEAAVGTISLNGYSESNGNFLSLMDIQPSGENFAIYYDGAQDTSLKQGDVYCIRISANHDYNDNFKNKTVDLEVWEGANGKDFSDSSKAKITVSVKCIPTDANANGTPDEANDDNDRRDAFFLTYWFTVTQRVQKPIFVIRGKAVANEKVGFKGLYLYQLKGYNSTINDHFSSRRSALNVNSGRMNSGDGIINKSVLAKSLNVKDATDINTTYNYWKDSGGNYHPIWLGFGNISAEGYQDEYYSYPIEFNVGGAYYDVYLPLNNNKDITLTKISSSNADKRRSIKGEKSNRFSLLETVASTFKCFTRFVVEHESDGRIKLDEMGNPTKRFTFVSETGRRNLNGFQYGVNLQGISRTIDSNNLVTKCHVENVDNQYDDSNMITIQNSVYNKLGMTFLYNFSYYINKGILNKSKFLNDYNDMVNYVKTRANENMKQLKDNASLFNEKTELETIISTNKTFLDSYKSTANDYLSYIKWNRFIYGGTYNNKSFEGHLAEEEKNKGYCNFPNINIEYLRNYNSSPSQNYYYYDEGKITAKFDTPPGSQYTTTTFHNVDSLARYMAFNCIGSVPSGRPLGTFDSQPTPQPTYVTSTSQYWCGGLSKDTVKNTLNNIFSLQTSYRTAQATISDKQKELDRVNKRIDNYNKIVNKNTEEINNKIKRFEKQYQQFIIEGQWSGSDYTDADTYYLDATRAHADSCMPKVSYSIDAMDLSKLCNPLDPSDTTWGREFTYDVGWTSYVKDEELFGLVEQLVMISKITSHVDVEQQDKIELRNYETRFEELFQSVAAAVTSLQINENMWGRAANFSADGTINESALQSSFNNNKNLVISSANNTVTQDNNGITIIDKDTGKVTKLIGGGIFLSTDNGNTFKTGLTPDGINASLITAGQVDTSKIRIGSSTSPAFILDDQGLTGNRNNKNAFTRFDQFGVYYTKKANQFNTNWWSNKSDTQAAEHIRDNSEFSLTELGLDIKYTKGDLIFGTIGYDTNGAPNEWGLKITKSGKDVVKINSSGDAFFKGEIEAGTGNIGGWTISDEDNWNGGIYKDVGEYRAGMKIGSKTSPQTGYAAFYVTKNPLDDNNRENLFYVTFGGKLYAKNAEIEGKITADSGVLKNGLKIGTSKKLQIGEYKIDENSTNVYSYISTDTPTDTGSGNVGTLQPIKSTLLFGSNFVRLYYSTTENSYGNGIVINNSGGNLHGTWSGTSGAAVTSDINKKHEISTLSLQYSNFFDNLRPVTYKYNDGTSNRLHTGFIAQEVNDALENAQIDTQDFAGLVILNRGTKEEEWTLRYSEFIALNTSEIQKLKSRVSELESKLKTLTSV